MGKRRNLVSRYHPRIRLVLLRKILGEISVRIVASVLKLKNFGT